MVNKALIYIAIVSVFFACKNEDISSGEDDHSGKSDSLTIAIDTLTSLTTDNENIVWIGTKSGLLGYNGTKWKLFQSSADFPVASNSITDLAYDSSGIWMGSEKGITYLKSTFDDVVSTEVYLKEQSGSDIVTKIDVGEDNDYWFATPEGIILKEGENWPNVSHYYTPLNFKSHPITSIANINDTCYGGTYGGGVVRYFKGIDGVSGASALWPGNGGGLASSIVNCVYVDKSKFLWLGLPSGVQKHTDSNPKITGNNWFLYTTEDGLIDNGVTAIVQDQQGFMWFGTNKGISKYDGIKWTSFTSADGLANDTILDLAVDSENHIWALSNSTLSLYDGEKWSPIDVPDSVKIKKKLIDQ